MCTHLITAALLLHLKLHLFVLSSILTHTGCKSKTCEVSGVMPQPSSFLCFPYKGTWNWDLLCKILCIHSSQAGLLWSLLVWAIWHHPLTASKFMSKDLEQKHRIHQVERGSLRLSSAFCGHVQLLLSSGHLNIKIFVDLGGLRTILSVSPNWGWCRNREFRNCYIKDPTFKIGKNNHLFAL